MSFASCRKSLADLQLDYLDLYLVHWPFPNYPSARLRRDARSPDARPYIHENFMKTWREDGRAGGPELVRHIGTSNMTVPKLELLLRDARSSRRQRDGAAPAFPAARVVPLCGTTEFSRSAIVRSVRRAVRSAIARPTTRTRWTTRSSSALRAPNVDPAGVCLKWAVQRGEPAIPFSQSQELLSKLNAAAGNR